MCFVSAEMCCHCIEERKADESLIATLGYRLRELIGLSGQAVCMSSTIYSRIQQLTPAPSPTGPKAGLSTGLVLVTCLHGLLLGRVVMSKLIKFKGWLTLVEAAEYLSTNLSETVSEADLLRFAVNGHIKLSVNFVNHTTVRFLKPLNDDELAAHQELLQDLGSMVANGLRLTPTLDGLHMEDGVYLKLDERVSSIDGIWDLAMAGGEALDILHRLQGLTGGASIELVSIDGSFVRKGDLICQLVESFEDNEYSPGSKAEGAALEAQIHNQGLSEIEAAKLRGDYLLRREVFLENKKSKPHQDNYYPRDGLPEDSNLVVEANALVEFLRTVHGIGDICSDSVQKEMEALRAEIEQLKAEKAAIEASVAASDEINPRKEETLYKLLLGLAYGAYRYDPTASKSTTTTDMQRDLEELGITLSERTIRNHLNAAKAFLPGKPRRT